MDDRSLRDAVFAVVGRSGLPEMKAILRVANMTIDPTHPLSLAEAMQKIPQMVASERQSERDWRADQQVSQRPDSREIHLEAPKDTAKRQRETLSIFKPVVLDLRRRLFGQATSPPFATHAQAAQWCRAQGTPLHVGKGWGDHAMAAQTAVDEANRHRTDLRLALELQHPPRLAFWTDEKRLNVDGVDVGSGNLGAVLRDESLGLADAMFADPADVVGWILVGKRPPVETFRLSVKARPMLPDAAVFRRRLFFEIDEESFTHDRLRVIHRRVRSALRLTGTKPRLPKVRRLQAEVLRRGRPSREYDSKYWREIVTAVGGWRADQWRAAAEAFRRFERRISREQSATKHRVQARRKGHRTKRIKKT